MSQLQKHHKHTQPPVHTWITLATKQAPVVDPLMVVQLDGRHMVRLLRRKSCHIVLDKSGHGVQWNKEINAWKRYSFWDDRHLGFLVKSDADWISMSSMQHCHVTNPMAVRQIPEAPPTT